MNYIDLTPDNNFEKKFFSEIAEHLKDIPYTIVSKNFGDQMPSVDGDKIILMNADEQYRIPDEVNDPSVKFIFKQYCQEGSHFKLRPIPLGPSKDIVITKKIPLNKRKFDVSFLGQMAYNRKIVWDNVGKFLSNPNISSFFGLYQGFNKGISPEAYSDIMKQTKIAICPHGTASPETFRFFEAMNFGCVVIAPEQPNNWIYKDSPHYKLENNLYSQVINILKNPPDNKMFYDYSEKIGSENTAKYIKEQI